MRTPWRTTLLGTSLVLLLAPAAGAERVRLAGGDVLTGRLVERSDDLIRLEHPTLGLLEIPADAVESIEVDPADAEAAPPPEEPAPPPAPARAWKSHFQLGANGSFGNTDTQSFQIGVESIRKRVRDRTKLDAQYFYDASDGDRTENKLTAGLLQEWLLPDSPWLTFAEARYDYDQFQSWEHRAGLHGGVGYRIFDDEVLSLTVRGGLGFTKEWKSREQELRWEGQFGFDLGWQIDDRQRLELSTTIYPELDDPSSYRVVSKAGWRLDVDDESNLSLHAGLRNEYQTDVDPGVKHNDLNVFVGLGFDF